MAFEIKPIKEVAKVFTGKTPSKSVSEYFGGDIPFVTPAELDKGHFVYSSAQTLSKRGAETIKLLPKDSVMVCCIGSLGKIGIAGRKLATNQQINSVVFDDKKVNFKYGFYALSRLKPLMEKIAPITTIPIINKSSFEQLEMPIPPLEQQTHIANILDHATSLIEKRKAQIVELDQLVQSVFGEIFSKSSNKKEKWGNIFHTKTGKLDSNAMVDGGIYPFFTCAKEVFAINDYAFDCEALLLAGNNAAGKYDVKHYKGKFNAYQRTYVLTLKNKDLSYLYFKVALERKLSYLQMQSKGTNTKYLTLSTLNDLEFIIPIREQQDLFDKIVQQIQTQKSQLQASLAELELNYQSLMQRAFRGDL
ncbi:restriction endonuclease subunit S [Actinobacillus pleuropneumoniae]|uniref:restriction endonuclease subunit S n=1 Tax=Actinobacillus pleuropneumoniae TaxID=715 RepID=UPI003AAB3C12